MGALEQLHHVCRRHGLRLALHILEPTGHKARDYEIHPYGSLAIRIVHPEKGVAVGRCQSDPGRESIEELARSCIELLERRGYR